MSFLNHLRICLFLLCSLTACARQEQTIAEKLGYDKNAKLLIIHADDLGVSHSENKASMLAMEQGSVSSGSIMVPCPWFPEIAAYARKHKDTIDLGLHLTLTSEWRDYKWGSVASSGEVKSLLNAEGYFYATTDSLLMHVKPAEAERELRSQIEKALKSGIDVTHLDAHMGAVLSSKELVDIYRKLGREYQIPVLLPKGGRFSETPEYDPKEVLVDHVWQASPEDYDKNMDAHYTEILSNLPAGLNYLLIHAAYDNDEMQAVTRGQVYWGATWRQRDFDFFTSEKCRKLLKENNIQIITWRMLRDKIVRQ